MKKKSFLVTVYYFNIPALEIEGPLQSIIKKMLEIEDTKGESPFYIEINEVKYLYNRDVYTDFLHGTYKNLQVFEDLKFDNLCRNKETMVVDGYDIDSGNLWVHLGNKVNLVDDDLYLQRNYDEDLFIIIIPLSRGPRAV